MINKIIKSVLTIGLIFFGVNSFVNGAVLYNEIFDLNLSEEINDSKGNYFELKSNGNFLLNDNYKYFSIYNKRGSSKFLYNYFWFDDGVYFTITRPGTSSNDIISYGSKSWQGYLPVCEFSKNVIPSGCKISNYNQISDFYNNIYYSSPDSIQIIVGNSVEQDIAFCFIYDDLENKYCSYIDYSYCFSNNDCRTGSLDFVKSPIDTSEYSSLPISQYVKNSTWSYISGGGSGGITVNIGTGGIEIGSTGSAINYYEKTYGRDEKICYAGVNNVTDLYGSPVSFHEGSGLNIFQVFSGLYGNTDLNKMYVWLNSWLINHQEFEETRDSFGDPHPSYFALYNSGTNQVDLIYTGLDVSPFLNNPVAIYFLVDYISLRSPPLIGGSQIVSYCNLKINNGSFDDIIEQSDKNNIDNYTEKLNTNIGLNPDGTVVEQPNWFEYLVGTGEFGSGGNVSWDQLQYTGDINLKGFFDNAIDEMKSAIHNQSDNPFTGVLPNYIIFALLMVVLFKILKK